MLPASPVRATTSGEFAVKVGRYLSFVWLLEEAPARADLFTLSSIRRRNHERGLRFLPTYLARYLKLLGSFTLVGFSAEALAAPALLVGGIFTLACVAAVAAAVAGAGLIGLHTAPLPQRGEPSRRAPGPGRPGPRSGP